jgi:hypothetical protein
MSITDTVETNVPRGAAASALRKAGRSLRQSPYPRVVSRGLLQVARVQTALWDRAMGRVEEEQRKALAAIVRHARDTELGRRQHFADIHRYEDFVRQVPVGDYDTFAPYIDRMRAGAKNLLVPEFVRYYGNSSGSSVQGKSKFLPITERQIAHTRMAGSNALFRYLAWRGDADFLTGFTLGLFPPITMKQEGEVFITSNPALMSTRLPPITRPVMLPNDEHKRIASYEEKLRKVAAAYLDHDVRSVTGTTCWFSLLFERVLEAAANDGRRVSSVAEIWPNLRVLIGGGVSADPYMPIIKKLLGRDDVALVDSYNATEGGLYATTDFRGRGMLMLPHRGTFFEFVPVSERDQPSPRRVPLWAVERDVPYSIVVTTVAGLYAYEIGDIVRFPSTDPLRIEFMGRLAGCLSITQELTTHVEIEQAVAHAVRKHPCMTKDFGAAADIGAVAGAKSRYVLYVEFEEGAAPNDLAAFAAAFDEGMCAANRVYREHRSGDVALLPPKVVPLPKGVARAFMADVTRGNVQGKFPRILDEGRKAKLESYLTAIGSQDG